MTYNIKTIILQCIISCSSILIGTLVGSLFSWIISKKTTLQTIEEQYKIINNKREYEEMCKEKEMKREANIVKLDICTTIFQSIRIIKEKNQNKDLISYPIPFNSNYFMSISMLSSYYDLKEISYIYQLYGIIQRLSITKNYDEYIYYCENIIKKVYGDNYEEVIKIDINNITFEELFNNSYIKEGYKSVISKLNEICS